MIRQIIRNQLDYRELLFCWVSRLKGAEAICSVLFLAPSVENEERVSLANFSSRCPKSNSASQNREFRTQVENFDYNCHWCLKQVECNTTGSKTISEQIVCQTKMINCHRNRHFYAVLQFSQFACSHSTLHPNRFLWPDD